MNHPALLHCSMLLLTASASWPAHASCFDEPPTIGLGVRWPAADGMPVALQRLSAQDGRITLQTRFSADGMDPPGFEVYYGFAYAGELDAFIDVAAHESDLRNLLAGVPVSSALLARLREAVERDQADLLVAARAVMEGSDQPQRIEFYEATVRSLGTKTVDFPDADGKTEVHLVETVYDADQMVEIGAFSLEHCVDVGFDTTVDGERLIENVEAFAPGGTFTEPAAYPPSPEALIEALQAANHTLDAKRLAQLVHPDARERIKAGVLEIWRGGHSEAAKIAGIEPGAGVSADELAQLPPGEVYRRLMSSLTARREVAAATLTTQIRFVDTARDGGDHLAVIESTMSRYGRSASSRGAVRIARVGRDGWAVADNQGLEGAIERVLGQP